MFRKKRKKDDMIDLRTLRKGTVVNIPKKDVMIPQNKEGFIEIGSSSTPQTSPMSTSADTSSSSASDNANFFGFMDSGSSSSEQTSSSTSFSTQTDGYNKREVDAKITELDNKIYRLEQRIELAERKLDINTNDTNVGPAGW